MKNRTSMLSTAGRGQNADARQEIYLVGNDGVPYTKYQTAQAIPEAAKNPGGLGGVGASIAVGMQMGNQMAGAAIGFQAIGYLIMRKIVNIEI